MLSSPNSIEPATFGRAFRCEYFNFDSAYTPLNHGSYGSFPTAVRDHQRALQDCIEARSDPYIRFTIPDLLVKSRAAAASYLGAPTDEVWCISFRYFRIGFIDRNTRQVQPRKVWWLLMLL